MANMLLLFVAFVTIIIFITGLAFAVNKLHAPVTQTIFVTKSSASTNGQNISTEIPKVGTWKYKIAQWSKGKDLPAIPDVAPTESVFYETSPINFDLPGWGNYAEFFVPWEGHSKSKKIGFETLLSKTDPTVFPNLGKDCFLVCPPKTGKSLEDYKNITLFNQNADSATKEALWRKVAETIIELENTVTSPRKWWISTHGASDPWLHIRICQEPKYYETEALKNL